MREPEVDVAIHGRGPVGCALALALRGSGLSVALVGDNSSRAAQKGPNGQAPFRPLALSYASRLILERIGAWEALPVTPIEQIHVSQAGGFGRTKISREDMGLPALGYVADYGRIADHLATRVDGAVRADAGVGPGARLVVHAEGTAQGGTTEKDYGYSAIVARVESERPAKGLAWERFAAEGPLALLPHTGAYGMVWSRTAEAAQALMAMDDRAFLVELQRAFGSRAGTFVCLGARTSVPLFLRYHTGNPAAGEVHIGNAAQTLHPVAGQGLNLGLRDAWALAGQVRAAARDALGSADFARQFARSRRIDARGTIGATDLMAMLYVRRDPLSAALRGAALIALDIFPPARKSFARRMIFGASAW